MKSPSKADLRVCMINHYSCCTDVNNQTKFIEIRLKISLTVVIIDRNRGNYGEKNVSVETIIYTFAHWILVLFIIFEVLFSIN